MRATTLQAIHLLVLVFVSFTNSSEPQHVSPLSSNDDREPVSSNTKTDLHDLDQEKEQFNSGESENTANRNDEGNEESSPTILKPVELVAEISKPQEYTKLFGQRENENKDATKTGEVRTTEDILKRNLPLKVIGMSKNRFIEVYGWNGHPNLQQQIISSSPQQYLSSRPVTYTPHTATVHYIASPSSSVLLPARPQTPAYLPEGGSFVQEVYSFSKPNENFPLTSQSPYYQLVARPPPYSNIHPQSSISEGFSSYPKPQGYPYPYPSQPTHNQQPIPSSSYQYILPPTFATSQQFFPSTEGSFSPFSRPPLIYPYPSNPSYNRPPRPSVHKPPPEEPEVIIEAPEDQDNSTMTSTITEDLKNSSKDTGVEPVVDQTIDEKTPEPKIESDKPEEIAKPDSTEESSEINEEKFGIDNEDKENISAGSESGDVKTELEKQPNIPEQVEVNREAVEQRTGDTTNISTDTLIKPEEKSSDLVVGENTDQGKAGNEPFSSKTPITNKETKGVPEAINKTT